MAANTVKVADLAKVQDVDFVNKFNGGIKKLLEVLGVSESIVMAPGTQLKIYKTSGTLVSGAVAEGEDIPLSKYDNKLDRTITVDFEKWRKQTTLEAVAKRGYGQAVTKTDDKMLRDIQKGIRSGIFNFLATGTGTATGSNFQKALANSWGKLSTVFEDDDATPVYFVNPMTIASYLGSAQVTLQTAFGFSYIENFLGLGTVVMASNIAESKVIATAKENINVYHANCSGIDGFDYYSDETGLVGIHHDPTYNNACYETYAVSALTLFPEFLDRIIVGTISGSEG